MVAFEIFGRPVYRYGLFYGITFLFGYVFLQWAGKQSFLDEYPRLQQLLRTDVDGLMLWIILGIMIGGRLGHVFFYDWGYYQQHIQEIFYVREGGMSFIGGVIGVVTVIFLLKQKHTLSRKELMLFGDLILCVVPLGILLGRIGNFLNHELYGIPVYPREILSSVQPDQAPWGFLRDQTLFLNISLYEGAKQIGLIYDYQLDVQPTMRVNTNILQSFGEGFLILVVTQLILGYRYVKKNVRAGMISGWFFVIYACARFLVEFLKDMPSSEYIGSLTISQWWMVVFFGGGVILLRQAQNDNKPVRYE